MQRATALIAAAAAFVTTTTDPTRAQQPPEQFGVKGQPDVEGRPTVDDSGQPVLPPGADEAPTGFDNKTNGFLSQGPAFDTAFAQGQLSVQTDCEAQYGAYSQNGKSGPLRRFAQNALPKAKERLDLARRLAGGR